MPLIFMAEMKKESLTKKKIYAIMKSERETGDGFGDIPTENFRQLPDRRENSRTIGGKEESV